jgi:tetraacyldisaccharide 4'-kinase
MRNHPQKPRGLANRLVRFWFLEPNILAPWQIRVLARLEVVYLFLWRLRQWFYQRLSPPLKAQALGVKTAGANPVRIIAVGNLVVGGAGKTPCVLALAKAFAEKKIPVGILSRGYKSQAEHRKPRVLLPYDLMNVTPQEVGDEAWLMAWRTERPVAVGKDRLAAVKALLAADPAIEVVILDDGLQQRALAWDHSLLVLDERGMGNGHCLPLGPLREPVGDLARFSYWLDHGVSQTPAVMASLGPGLPQAGGRLIQVNGPWIPIAHWRDGRQWLDQNLGLSRFRGQSILAIAGIAVPDRFFNLLRSMGLQFDELATNDHDQRLVEKAVHAWQRKNYDLVLMTEKDAVKFFHQATPLHPHAWALRREVQLEQHLLQGLF